MKAICINPKFEEYSTHHKLFSKFRIYNYKKEADGFEIEDDEVKSGISDTWWWITRKEFKNNFVKIKNESNLHQS